MKYYNWWSSEAGAGYVGKCEADDRKLLWYDNLMGDPLPSLSDWIPPILTQYLGPARKGKRRPICDSVASASVNLVSHRAQESLADIWDKHAILYPVTLDDAPNQQSYYMVVVTTELDCLNRDRSTGPLQKYGPTPDRFASVHTWEFDNDCVGGADVFVVPDSRTNVFVSETFKRRVAEAELKGFCLRKEFWDEDPWIS